MAALDGLSNGHLGAYMLSGKHEDMAKLTRQLDERIRGDDSENKDWWRLVFDTEAKRFYIEHEWSHTDAWRAARSNTGTVEFDINGFLAEGDETAQAELLRIIESLFENQGDENA